MIYRHEDRIAMLEGWIKVSCFVENDRMCDIKIMDEQSGQEITVEQEMFFTLLGSDAMEFYEQAMLLAQNVKFGSVIE